jgi:hypothetical protein
MPNYEYEDECPSCGTLCTAKVGDDNLTIFDCPCCKQGKCDLENIHDPERMED